MCGIWGVFSNRPQSWLTAPDVDLARTMMLFTSARGDHSTGVCTIPQRALNPTAYDPVRPVRIAKAVGGPHNILHREAGIEFMKWSVSYGNKMFGHGRLATRGKISVENAHPFDEGDWILAHNGTIYSGLKHGGENEPEVDSHALCLRIDEVGLKEALLSITGAYAVIAYNKKENKIYCARNADRPLWHFTADNMTWVMSEEDMLRTALKRHGKYVKGRNNMENLEQFKPEVLYELTEDGFQDTGSIKKKEKIREITHFPIVASGSGGHTHLTEAQRKYQKQTEGYGDVNGPIRKNEMLTFLVDNVVADGTQFEYTCAGDRKEGADYIQVVFRTNQKLPDLIGRTGTAPLHLRFVLKNTKQVQYFVKYKDIKWDEKYDGDESPGADDDTPELVPCDTCSEPVELPHGGTQLHNLKWVCNDCVDDFERNNSFKLNTRVLN